jgi:glycosyltransferase involved in cell wall biosynthesis
VARIAFHRVRFQATTLYYPPAGPERVPILRDLALLIATRWMFSSVIFHFHAGGLANAYTKFGPFLRVLFQIAYYRADIGIRTSIISPPDAALLHAKQEFVIPNAAPDVAQGHDGRANENRTAAPVILYVGALRESKGVLILLDACRNLVEQGCRFQLQLMGEFQSRPFEEKVRQRARDAGLDIEYLGVLTGSKKDSAFAGASIFCFPSFYESEASPVVLIEAMAFSLPIVATNWRGIPAIVSAGENGFLVPIMDAAPVTARLHQLLEDSDLRTRMGANGRRKYEETYTVEAFHASISRMFLDLERAPN